MGKNTNPPQNKTENQRPTGSIRTGIIAFVFLIIGYQTALMFARIGRMRAEDPVTLTDTVYLLSPDEVEAYLARLSEPEIRAVASGAAATSSESTPYVSIRREAPKKDDRRRKVESFPFNPNTVSIEDLVRLGFSQKQAEAIDRYRQKGGHFSRKEDFARSYVVDDSVYRRLEPWIDIPKVDLNRADSAALTSLPGIGPWFAQRILEHREVLRGYSYPEQLLDLPRFDQEKYEGLKDLISVTPVDPYPLWTLPEEELKQHPYIRAYAARGIVFFREHNPPEACTVDALVVAGVLDPADGEKLARCRIAEP